MALTLTAAWHKAFARSTVQPVMLAAITVDSTTYKAMSAHSSALSYPLSLTAVKPVRAEMDPWSRANSVGSCELTFAADGWAKALLVAHKLRRGQKVEVLLGAKGLAEVDYAPYFAGIIDKALPTKGGAVRVTVVDAFGFLRDAKIAGDWFNMHPLEVVADILEKAGVPSSLIDADSLDPVNYPESSHWVISRGQLRSSFQLKDVAVGEPTDALPLLDEVCALLNGTLFAGEDGVLKYVAFDADGDLQDGWTDDDLGDSLEVIELDGNAINSVTVEFGPDPESGRCELYYRRDEALSQASLAYEGETKRVLAARLATPWVDGKALLQGTMTTKRPKVGGAYNVYGEMTCGFCGTRWPGFPGTSQPLDARLRLAAGDVERTAYHLVDEEIIEVYACAVADSEFITTYILEKDNDAFGDSEFQIDRQKEIGPFATKAVFVVKQRGALGTSVAAHAGVVDSADSVLVSNARVVDVTIPVAIAAYRLARWAFGMAIVEVETGLDKHHVQLADLVPLITDQFCGPGRDELLANDVVFEAIGKETDPDKGLIRWTLAYATEAEPPAQTVSHAIVPGVVGGYGPTHDDLSLNQRDATSFVYRGFAATAAGLEVTIAAGVATTGAASIKKTRSQTFELTNNKTTYFCLDMASSAFTVKEDVSGTSAPTQGPTEMALWKAVAVAGVVTLTDQRNTTGVRGGLLGTGTIAQGAVADGAIGSAQLADAAVGTAQLADDAVSALKLQNGAASAAKVGTGAIKETKVATAAIGALKTKPSTTTKTVNPTFSLLKGK